MMNDDPLSFGERFYKELVKTQPSVALLFKDTEVRKQGAKFISMLRHAIRLLDDEKTFHIKLEALSSQHVAYGVQVQHLEAFGKVLVAELRRVNSKIWTTETSNAWDWFWSIVMELFSAGLRLGNYSSNCDEKVDEQ